MMKRERDEGRGRDKDGEVVFIPRPHPAHARRIWCHKSNSLG